LQYGTQIALDEGAFISRAQLAGQTDSDDIAALLADLANAAQTLSTQESQLRVAEFGKAQTAYKSERAACLAGH